MLNNEKIIDRIKKLLALSQSTNEHEAASAAEKAAQLMQEYQISDAELRAKEGKPAEPIVFRILSSGKNKLQWKMDIAMGLCEAFGGHAFYSGGNIIVLAHETIAQTVEYMSNYLYNEVDRLAEQAFLNHGQFLHHGKTWKHSFRLGASRVIYVRLYTIGAVRVKEQKQIGNSAALAVIQKDQFDLEVAWKKLQATFKGEPHKRRDNANEAQAFNAGQRAGESVSLNHSTAPRLRG